jgi:hypothetical protein
MTRRREPRRKDGRRHDCRRRDSRVRQSSWATVPEPTAEEVITTPADPFDGDVTL